MTTFQKIIKYGAIAFGAYLCVIIISAIILAITTIFGITVGMNAIEESFNNNNQTVIESVNYEYTGIEKLNIELGICKLNIQNDETLTDKIKVEMKNTSNKMYCKQLGNELKIDDDKNVSINFLKNRNIVPEITIYIPQNQEFENVDLNVSINDVNIEKLNAKKAKIETGGGRCIIKNIITEQLDIEGGAGETIVENSKTNRLELDAGIGSTIITAEILDTADINSGVGRLELNLLGSKENYMIKPSVGIGGVVVDNQRAENEKIIGNGNQKVKIDAGIGEVAVNFIENQVL